MYRRNTLQFLVFVLVAALAVTSARIAAQTPDATPDATPDTTPFAVPDTVELYAPLRLSLPVDPTLYTNPFDPADVELLGIFDAPDGEQRVIPGFWMQPYEDRCPPPCASEDLHAVGTPVWQVRFTPDLVGDWSYSLQLRDNGTIVTTQDGSFSVTPSARRGSIQVGANGRYFAYQNGEPYFPIGHNLFWSWDGAGGVRAYEAWFDRLAASGGSYARVVVDTPFFIGLEWDALGDYRDAQIDAARLDLLLQLAEERGIALQLVLLWHQALQTYDGVPVLVPEDPPRADASADWDDNPYNSARGGTLTGAGQFFFEDNAENLFRRRLRYIAARWGYSPAVFAWEVIDQIDRTAAFNPETSAGWLQDTVSYLRQIDQGRHLITAGSSQPLALTTSNPLLDFVQVRYYQRLPFEAPEAQEGAIIDRVRAAHAATSAPVLLTEYSLNPWYEPADNDPAGIHVQNSLWAAALAGAAGGGMSAWGDTYIDPLRLDRFYAPLSAYATGVPWTQLALASAEASLAGDPSLYQPVRFDGFNRRFRQLAADSAPRTLTADGVYPPLDGVPSYLYGQLYNSELAQPHVYRVSVPIDTFAQIAVRQVSEQANARLVIVVDEAVVVELDLPPGAQPSVLRVPLAAGEHTLTLVNAGDDWVELDYIQIDALAAPARVVTLRDTVNGVALSWLHHSAYTWDNAEPLPEPVAFRYRLDAMPPGRYLVEQWQPLSGGVVGEEVVRVADDGVLMLELLPFNQQLALRAFRLRDDAPVTPDS